MTARRRIGRDRQGDHAREQARLFAERARRTRAVVDLGKAVPADGHAHHVTAAIDADGHPTHPVTVDGRPQGVGKSGEIRNTVKLDTRPLVVVTLQEVTLGRGTGWRATCSNCPGFAPANAKAAARGKAFAHVQEHDAAGHRVQMREPAGETKRRKAKR